MNLEQVDSSTESTHSLFCLAHLLIYSPVSLIYTLVVCSFTCVPACPSTIATIPISGERGDSFFVFTMELLPSGIQTFSLIQNLVPSRVPCGYGLAMGSPDGVTNGLTTTGRFLSVRYASPELLIHLCKTFRVIFEHGDASFSRLDVSPARNLTG